MILSGYERGRAQTLPQGISLLNEKPSVNLNEIVSFRRAALRCLALVDRPGSPRPGPSGSSSPARAAHGVGASKPGAVLSRTMAKGNPRAMISSDGKGGSRTSWPSAWRRCMYRVQAQPAVPKTPDERHML